MGGVGFRVCRSINPPPLMIIPCRVHDHHNFGDTTGGPWRKAAAPCSVHGIMLARLLKFVNAHIWDRFFCLVALFENVFSPEGWQTNVQKGKKISHVWTRSIVQWVQPFPHVSLMHKPPQMHLNTSPTCLEGPRARKIRFTDPGPETRV